MADRPPGILFHFMHLLGVGHVHRARRLVDAFTAQGTAVDIVYGGLPLEGLDFATESIHYLPPIRAEDASYKQMLDGDGNAVTRAYLDVRTQKLLEIFADLSPDAILTEAFPFGRRIIRHEIDALLTAAAQRDKPPLIVSSVRDILQENRKPGRTEEARDWIADRFDKVLVHADSQVIRLDATFPLAKEIRHKLAYTGFVVPVDKKRAIDGSFDVIVSVGGGGFGAELMLEALSVAKDDPGRRWCLATGPNLNASVAQKLRADAASHVTVVERLDHLAEHMKRARLSVSQCGYNTAMDVLAAHETSACRAVFVPHDTTGQTEQLRRARLLADAGYAIALPQSQLTAETLRAAMKRAGELEKVETPIDFDGAAKSAQLLNEWIEARR